MQQFKCSRCKKTLRGVPAMINACGAFCSACVNEIATLSARARAANRAAAETGKKNTKTAKEQKPLETPTVCILCGEPTSGRYTKIHRKCAAMLARVVKCGPEFAKYIAKLEKNLGPERDRELLLAAEMERRKEEARIAEQKERAVKSKPAHDIDKPTHHNCSSEYDYHMVVQRELVDFSQSVLRMLQEINERLDKAGI